jgi:hypothetical protein
MWDRWTRLRIGNRRWLLAGLVASLAFGSGVVARSALLAGAPIPVDPSALWCHGLTDEEIAAYPREKLEVLARECRDIEAGAVSAAPVPASPEPLPPESPPPWREGLFGEEDADDFPAPDLRFTSMWRKVIGGLYVEVRVGWVQDPVTGAEDPSQARILYRAIDPGTMGGSLEVITPPVKGPLAIRSVDGALLTLANPSGETAVFDASEGRFVKG